MQQARPDAHVHCWDSEGQEIEQTAHAPSLVRDAAGEGQAYTGMGLLTESAHDLVLRLEYAFLSMPVRNLFQKMERAEGLSQGHLPGGPCQASAWP